MERLQVIFPLIFIVLRSSSATNCDHSALNVCQNLQIEMQEDFRSSNIKEGCEKYQASTECFNNYVRDCVTDPQQKEQMSQLTSQIPNIKEMCDDAASPNEKLDVLQCLKEELSDIHTPEGPCGKDMKAAQEIQGETKDENSLQKACCAYKGYMKCWQDIVKEKCGDKALNYMIGEKAKDMDEMETMCKKYECSGSSLTGALPVWILIGIVTLQLLGWK